jgi:PAS domain S-box-containing protein
MEDDARSEEILHKELMELHQRITELDQLDIERKRTKNKLKKIEEQINEIFGKENKTITIVQERQIKYVNPHVEELIGYTPEEVIGNSFAHYIHPDELPRVAKNYLQRVAGADIPNIYTTVLKHKNGSDVHVEIKASVVQFQDKLADFAIIRKIAPPDK